MTSEKIYSNLLEYVNTLNEDDQKFILKSVNANCHYDNCGIGTIMLINLMVDLKEDIAFRNAKQNGNTDSLKAAKDILKVANKGCRDACKGAWIANGKQIVTDCYRALRFNTPLELPVLPDSFTPINMEQIFSGVYTNSNEYPLPTIGELKTFIAMEKANGSRNGIEYDIGKDYPLVNAEYLLTMISGLQNCKAYFANAVMPIYLKGDNGDGLVVPIRRMKTVQESA